MPSDHCILDQWNSSLKKSNSFPFSSFQPILLVSIKETEMKNEASSMVPMPHPHSLKKNTLKALKKCMAVEEETGIELITPPIWHELNKGTADTYVGLFASTPETFELRITFLT